MADYSGVHMSHSPYIRVPGDVNLQCGAHPTAYCASNDWGTGIHDTTHRVAEAYVAAYFRHNGALCGKQNPGCPGEYFCSFQIGHAPIHDIEFDPVDGDPRGPSWDHASPDFGAAWNMPQPFASPSAPSTKERPVTILDSATLKVISTVVDALNSLNADEWPDVYLTADLKTKAGDKIGAFTDEYGDWVFETSSDGE